MKSITIRGIFTVDFRKSPRTLYDELRKDKSAWRGDLRNGDTYIFVSTTGNQLVFILGDHTVTLREGTRFASSQQLLDYRGWRIEGSSFHPLMLENYANQVGLTLSKKRLEDWYAERVAARRG